MASPLMTPKSQIEKLELGDLVALMYHVDALYFSKKHEGYASQEALKQLRGLVISEFSKRMGT